MSREATSESKSPESSLSSPAVTSGDRESPRRDPSSYVGTPALGTSKAAPAAGIASTGPANTIVDRRRRRFVWSGIVAFLAAWFIAFFRFFLPRVLFEPANVFKIGYPGDYALGIDEKWLQRYRIWVDRTAGCVHPIGNPPRINSSAHVMAVVMIVRGLTSKARRRGRWIAPGLRWPPMDRFSSTWADSTPGRRAREISLTIREHFCRHEFLGKVQSRAAHPSLM